MVITNEEEAAAMAKLSETAGATSMDVSSAVYAVSLFTDRHADIAAQQIIDREMAARRIKCVRGRYIPVI